MCWLAGMAKAALPADIIPEYETSADIWKRLARNPSGEALLSDALVAAFELLLLEGNTRSNCTRIVGLQRTTLQQWLEAGLDDVQNGRNTLAARLLWTIDRCEGEQERRLARAATRAALSPVTEGALALKLLERRNPDHWAPAIPAPDETDRRLHNASEQQLKEEARKVLKQATAEVVVKKG